VWVATEMGWQARVNFVVTEGGDRGRLDSSTINFAKKNEETMGILHTGQQLEIYNTCLYERVYKSGPKSR